MFRCQSDILHLAHLFEMRAQTKDFSEASKCKTSARISRDQTLSPFHAASITVRSHKVHAALHIYRGKSPPRSLAPSSRYYLSTRRYREAAKTMIDPESRRHAAAACSSRFKIIACFPPPIFCLSPAITGAILAAPYSADGSHCLLLLRSPQTGFKAVLLVNNGIL